MGQFTATTLGLLEAACALALVAAVTALALVQTRRARRADSSERRRSCLLDALRHGRRGPLLAACEVARTDEDVREDVRSVAGLLALAPQRSLLVAAARDAGLDTALHESLSTGDDTARGRAASLLGLLRLGTAAALAPLLLDPEGEVRLSAARAIAMLDSPESARTLIAALDGGVIDPPRLIEQLARPSAVPELVRALAAPELVSVRADVAEALGQTRSPLGIGPLASLVRVGLENERVRACRALGRIARPEVVPLLVEALADDAWSVRAEAARGLTGLADGSCVPELEAALSDGAWWVRANAADALRSIGPSGVAALVRASNSDDRVMAARAREALSQDDGDDGSLGLAA